MTGRAEPGHGAGFGLDIERIRVDYGGNVVLDVELGFASRRVDAVLGANGSGKSSLLKALAGVCQGRVELDAQVMIDGRPARRLQRLTPGIAHAAGLRFVHQDLGLIEEQSVLDNIFLSRGRPSRLGAIDWRSSRAAARRILDELNCRAEVDAAVHTLRPAEKVLVAVARALHDLPAAGGIIFVDEPTAGLDYREAEDLLRRLGEAVRNGAGLVLVTHRLDEVESVADRARVLHDGRIAAEFEGAEVTAGNILEAMGGEATKRAAASRPAAVPRPEGPSSASPLLRLTGVSTAALDRIDLEVRPGEILAVVGFEGSGKEDLVDLLFGLAQPQAGAVEFGGAAWRPASPSRAVRQGMALVPADRVQEGGVPELDLTLNLHLPRLRAFTGGLRYRRREAEAECGRWLRRFEVKPPSPRAEFASLSGGNQQKVIFARWLATRPRLAILHEPTAGVDARAREFIWGEVRREAAAGLGFLLITSDLAEVEALSSCAVILLDGKVSGTLSDEEITVSNMLSYAMSARR